MAAEMAGARAEAEAAKLAWEQSAPVPPPEPLPLLDDVCDGDSVGRFYGVRDSTVIVDVLQLPIVGWSFRLARDGQVLRPETDAMCRRFMGCERVDAALARRLCAFVREIST